MSVSQARMLYSRFTRGRLYDPEEKLTVGDCYWCDHTMVRLTLPATAGELAAVSCSVEVRGVEEDTEADQ